MRGLNPDQIVYELTRLSDMLKANALKKNNTSGLIHGVSDGFYIPLSDDECG